jgi:hypothetical protein
MSILWETMPYCKNLLVDKKKTQNDVISQALAALTLDNSITET